MNVSAVTIGTDHQYWYAQTNAPHILQEAPASLWKYIVFDQNM